MIKLSVIVPVYNVEDYLDTCVKSLLNQGLSNYEIILVNDCSLDNSGLLCDEWAEKDARIKVIHCVENGGLSEARNRGLVEAKGEYVTFVDSDDFVAPKSYQLNLEMLESNPEVDVIEFPVNIDYGSRNAHILKPGNNEKVTFVKWVERQGYCHCYAWNKIYRRSVWQGKTFPKGKLMEDLYTIPYLMSSLKTIMLSDKGMYCYCSREGTISRSINPRSAGDYQQAYLKLYNWLLDECLFEDEILDDVYLRLCNAQIVLMELGLNGEIPQRYIKLGRAIKSKMPMKAVLCSLFRHRYCPFVVKMRKFFKK